MIRATRPFSQKLSAIGLIGAQFALSQAKISGTIKTGVSAGYGYATAMDKKKFLTGFVVSQGIALGMRELAKYAAAHGYIYEPFKSSAATAAKSDNSEYYLDPDGNLMKGGEPVKFASENGNEYWDLVESIRSRTMAALIAAYGTAVGMVQELANSLVVNEQPQITTSELDFSVNTGGFLTSESGMSSSFSAFSNTANYLAPYYNSGVGAGAMSFAVGGLAMSGGRTATRLVNLRARSASRVLNLAERWLGDGYSRIDRDVYRSADGLKGFRMTSLNKVRPYVNFERFSPGASKPYLNMHVPIVGE